MDIIDPFFIILIFFGGSMGALMFFILIVVNPKIDDVDLWIPRLGELIIILILEVYFLTKLFS